MLPLISKPVIPVQRNDTFIFQNQHFTKLSFVHKSIMSVCIHFYSMYCIISLLSVRLPLLVVENYFF